MPYPEIYRRTPNASVGENKCYGVLLHHTGGSFASALSWLTLGTSGVSAHVIIGKDGRRAVLAPDEAICWHAGKSEWHSRYGLLKHCNLYMVGVEFEGDTTKEPLTDAQIASFIEWLIPRAEKHKWRLDDVTHHRVVSPGRKVDLEPKEFERVRAAIAGYLPD
jgi:N-acetylmuramoyl-L-alanine amidase